MLESKQNLFFLSLKPTLILSADFIANPSLTTISFKTSDAQNLIRGYNLHGTKVIACRVETEVNLNTLTKSYLVRSLNKE